MSTGSGRLSDKALAVFAFAIFHELESGKPVSHVILSDGAGHRADPEAVSELERLGLATTDGNRLAFTPAAEQLKAELVKTMRQRSQAPEPRLMVR